MANFDNIYQVAEWLSSRHSLRFESQGDNKHITIKSDVTEETLKNVRINNREPYVFNLYDEDDELGRMINTNLFGYICLIDVNQENGNIGYIICESDDLTYKAYEVERKAIAEVIPQYANYLLNNNECKYEFKYWIDFVLMDSKISKDYEVICTVKQILWPF